MRMRQNNRKEKVINGNVYYTYWGGNEVCAMWKDVKGKMMEQCFYEKK